MEFDVSFLLRPQQPSHVRVAPGLVIPRCIEFQSTADEKLPFDIHALAEWDPDAERYETGTLRARRRRDGRAITSEAIREIPVQALMARAIHFTLAAIRAKEGELGSARRITPEIASALRSAGPVMTTLEAVAFIYRLAQVELYPPAATVARTFDLPSRTASHWVKLARDRGHLTNQFEPVDLIPHDDDAPTLIDISTSFYQADVLSDDEAALVERVFGATGAFSDLEARNG